MILFKKYFYISICFFFLLVSCNNKKQDIGFYYWKTVYRNDALEQQALESTKSNKLYTRIMDIDFDASGLQAVPISPITFQDSISSKQQIVPVVFINQRIFKELDSLEIRGLAHKIVPFVQAKVKQSGQSAFQELQLDCDWTASSKNSFFYLLTYLQEIPEMKDITVSSTLRLHQVKNTATNGIPPVKKVTLMCYNMGNLRKFGNQNSILNQDDLHTYLRGTLKNYPLEVEIALPLFRWFVVFRDNNYIGISKYIHPQDIENKTLFTQNPKTNLYILNQNLPKANLKKGDVIRYEFVTKEDLLATTKFLKSELKNTTHQFLFYHLDQPTLAAYSHEDLQEIIDSF